ncbi:E3 ubiquitin-protein ligase TRIM32-like [Branchiostoma floridae x Branchiostoma japonicum]
MQKIIFGGKGTEPGKFIGNYGVAVSADNEIFVTDDINQRVQVFSISGTYLRLFPTELPGENRRMYPISVAIDVKPGYLWVVGNRVLLSACVVQYRRDGLPIEKFDVPVKSSYHHPVIAIDVRNNKVIVGDGDAVIVFQPNGSLVRSFKASFKKRNVRIYGVISDNKGNVLLTGHQSVKFYSQLGKKIFEFGNFGYGEGQLKSPRDILIGPSGHIIVANRDNNRVDKFTSRGEFVCTVANITCPWGVALGPDGQLVVTNILDSIVTIFSGHI